MDSLLEITKVLGGAAAMVGAAGALAMVLVKSMLKKDLAAFEHDLKRRADLELARINAVHKLQVDTLLVQFKDELDRARDVQARRADAERARDERLRAEVLRWANPIRGAVLDLRRRLDNILDDTAWPALHSKPHPALEPNWSIHHEYFLPSTLYQFCQYFHWVRRLELELGFELFATHVEKDAFMTRVRAVSQALGDWPVSERCVGTDCQVFNLQQRALGEALLVRDEGPRCMGYDEFLMQRDDSPLADLLPPLIALIENLEPSSNANCRWLRLARTRAALAALDAHTLALLQPPAPV
jgi:hypothetical protein